MTTKVEYTESLRVSSSLVEGIYFNQNDKTVVFDLNSRLYRYSNIERNDVLTVSQSASAGREYQTFKRKFGPGDYLGTYGEIEWKKIPLTLTVNRMGRLAPTYPSVTIDTDEVHADMFAGAITGIQHAIVNYPPSPEVYSDNAQWELNKEPEEYAKFRVGFKVVEDNGIVGSVSELKFHNLVATNVADAKNKVEELGETLGLDFKVKEVTVYFD